jgi:hypothetical protein
MAFQKPAPLSTKVWPAQQKEIDFAARALGVSRSRLLRHAALSLAAELREGAAKPQHLHR